MKLKQLFLSFSLLFLFMGMGMREPDTDFLSFLEHFTSSASFQYSRIKFPLQNEILLINSEGDEHSFEFTQDKWQLLDKETFVTEEIILEEDEVYISGFVMDDPELKIFEAGYEGSEIELRVVFELIEGNWYVTDCYNGWYSFDLPVDEFEDTILQVQEVNRLFESRNP